MLEKALKRAEDGVNASDADLFDELRIPSVSALPQHSEDVRRNAEWLADRMKRLGMSVQIVDIPGGRHPVLQADLVVDSSLPTLTIYGHYDVQPAEPLDEWKSPPFEPTVRDRRIYARGAADSKGNHMAALKAVEFCTRAGGPAVNVRFLLEGDEEISGHSLGDYLRQNSERLRTDWVLLWDGGFSEEGDPGLMVGLRGLLYVELRAEGPGIDLHSGVYGGVAPNPLNSLARALGELKRRDGRVMIPGFYDDVSPPTADDVQRWDKGPNYEEVLMKLSHSRVLEGEAEYPPIQRQWSRPTLDVHGLGGGFIAEGVKTVIPAVGLAKLSMRLVPDQDPDRIFTALQSYVNVLSTPGVRITVSRLGSTRPVRIGADHHAAHVAMSAFEQTFGKQARLICSGGSVPVAIDFVEALGAPIVASGLQDTKSPLHSPNEYISIDHYHRGIEMLIRFMHGLPVA